MKNRTSLLGGTAEQYLISTSYATYSYKPKEYFLHLNEIYALRRCSHSSSIKVCYLKYLKNFHEELY